MHRHFSNTDGLPDTAVPALLQTRDGFLWIGSAGLARFNGVSFRQLNEATTPGLGSRTSGRSPRTNGAASGWAAPRPAVAGRCWGGWSADG